MQRGSSTILFVYLVISVALLAIIYLFSPPETISFIFLPSLALISLLGVLLVIFHTISPHEKLKRRIKKMSTLILHEPSSVLKGLYMEIYNLYLLLSHRHQKKYYPHVMGIRRKLEEGMHAQHKVETLLNDIKGKDLVGMKKIYDEINTHFAKLPQKLQGQYYGHIVHIRQKLEGRA
jgi:hypothetical protein